MTGSRAGRAGAGATGWPSPSRAAARHAAEVVRLWDGADPILADRAAAMRRILERASDET